MLAGPLAPLQSAPWLALDYETQGLDVLSDQQIVGVGLSDGSYSVYVPLLGVPGEVVSSLHRWLCGRRLVAHNIPFDGAWFKRYAGRHADWLMDTQGMFRQLSTEGWFGQSWSLKTAMTNVLGWEAPNTDELHSWLKQRKLRLGDMWQAPTEILGKYCALDAMATAHLKTYFDTFRTQFPHLFDYHEQEFLTLVRLTTDQYLRGMQIDTPGLEEYREKLAQETEKIKQQFLTDSRVAPIVEQFNRARYDKWVESEPPQLTKSGTTTKRWEWWKTRERWAATNMHFKITSKDNLRWLFYEKLYETKVTKQPSAVPAKNFRDFGKFRVNVDGQWTDELLMTKNGQLSSDKKVLPHLGDLGKLLAHYNKLATELRFVDTCRKVVKGNCLHPRIKVGSTVTGRCSGGLER